MTELTELSYDRCLELLSGGVVGRIAVCTPSGPRILPVNYSVVHDSIVFRTTPYGLLGTHAWDTKLAFEVDHIDHERRQGWSVVATGNGAMIDDPDDLAAIRSHWDPQPWPCGAQRLLYVRLRWDELTGDDLAPARPRTPETPQAALERSIGDRRRKSLRNRGTWGPRWSASATTMSYRRALRWAGR